MRPFWKRRSRYTRVALYTLLCPLEILANAFVEAFIEGRRGVRQVRSNYKELWKTQ
jgi:hypothetical protein